MNFGQKRGLSRVTDFMNGRPLTEVFQVGTLSLLLVVVKGEKR